MNALVQKLTDIRTEHGFFNGFDLQDAAGAYRRDLKLEFEIALTGKAPRES